LKIIEADPQLGIPQLQGKFGEALTFNFESFVN
jgi:hypothetical protein